MAHTDQTYGNNVLRREWRQLGRLALESLGIGLFVSMVLALAVFIISFEARAAGNGDPGQGPSLLRDEAGARLAVPLPSTDVHRDVSRMGARVQVKQRHANPTAQWRVAVYVLPLSDKAALDVTPTKQVGADTGEFASPGNVPEGLTGFDLPSRTATPSELSMVVGLILLLVATVMAIPHRLRWHNAVQAI